ncbi:DnaJ domain-containing protein [Serpentinicella sp. ANB-PHB4]|uniref:DnaJ domain-containing protein n=1 Tax=Serpentinicella sp. ANB-PHB4 TaxID=3074076 RepID=UPI002859A266|nr:DnaJ domain-containing protein [Serpentinicella sp. ANB-PHB4]MDR5658459.1 DnaJ domain-containing protein [Serpentinicella sp. ANB-PHB4]
MKDYYKILEIKQDATEADIKKAYRQLAKMWHPDVNKPPGAQGKFVEISEAYEILSNPKSRAQYDQIKRNNSYEKAHHDFDFSKQQQQARERGEYYSSISLEDLFKKVFKTTIEVGKATLFGENAYNSNITLKDLLILGVKGWFGIVLLILTFTAVLAPITIPLLIKVVLIDKNMIVGFKNIFIGMILYIPTLVFAVLYLGYAVGIFYFYESEMIMHGFALISITVGMLLGVNYKIKKNSAYTR